MLKRMVSAVICAAILFAFAACTRGGSGSNDATAVSLKVWGAQEDQELLKGMIEEFKKANSNTNYNITLGVVGEKDTQAKFLEDPAAAADVFSFPDDQLLDLVDAGALYEITLNKDQIKKDNLAGAYDAACIGDSLYGYPTTADNGYFL